ncbi:hypothetical protein Ahy_B10g102822 [Arachis hypogaea]|uniref:Major facilitator superfamily (MFS) profile domain-containing protein n=1 Tax=Arachis hypogaea TaxID=3818 RepID=A0A444X2J2_ARAHY|nr:hypothetical protein Ahy_B10g102822 [Arachis hypogaea]
MSTIASTNGKHLPSSVLLALDEEVEVEAEEKTEALTLTYKNKPLENIDAFGGSIVDVFQSPVTRIRLILMVSINFFCAVVYYGLRMNVVNLDTNLYMNVGLNAVAEMPAYGLMAVLLEKLRRKPLAIGTMCFSGVGIFGHLSDIFLGRKGSLMVVCALNAIFGCLTGFSTGGVGLCAFILATDTIGPTKCGIARMSTFYFFSIGIAILSAVAYVFQTWRKLYIASPSPPFSS